MNKGFAQLWVMFAAAGLLIGGGAYFVIKGKDLIPPDIRNNFSWNFEENMKFSTSTPDSSIDLPGVIKDDSTPDIIRRVVNRPDGNRKIETDSYSAGLLKNKSEYSWFNNPVEVTKRYSKDLGFVSTSSISAPDPTVRRGEYSGLYHASVRVLDKNGSYDVFLVSQDGKTLWLPDAVIPTGKLNFRSVLDSKYGFELKYPTYLKEPMYTPSPSSRYGTIYDPVTQSAITKNITPQLSLKSVTPGYPEGFINVYRSDSYSFEDVPGGIKWSYDKQSGNLWTNSGNGWGIASPKVMSNWTGYILGTGDAGYSSKLIVIPNRNKNVVIEVGFASGPLDSEEAIFVKDAIINSLRVF